MLLHAHRMIFLQDNIIHPEKDENPTICDRMDGPWENYAKCNMPDTERQILYDLLICGI